MTWMGGAGDPASARARTRPVSAKFGFMGLFSHHHARDAYDQVYGGGRPQHEVTHELLAGAAVFEAMRLYEHHREREGIPEHHKLAKELLAGFVAAEVDKHFESGRYGHLNRHEAKRMAREQADYLYEQQYGARW
jgi:hypothetical protein